VENPAGASRAMGLRAMGRRVDGTYWHEAE
jgi:hypothetical protein